jgi:hypothetical protein
MRVLLPMVAVACLGAVMVAAGGDAGKDPSAVLAAAREALGGEKALSAVKSFVATGRTRQVRGQNLVPIEFEIACELPDKYVRKDEVPAQESEPTTAGFNGEKLIQIPRPVDPPPGAAAKPPAAPAAGGAPAAAAATAAAPAMPATAAAGTPPVGPPAPPPDPKKARVVSLKQDFARLTLGMFAASFDSYPLTFTFVGQAEAPQGKADVLEAKGPGTFTLRFFINAETHLPIMVSWTNPATNVVLTEPGQTAPASTPPGSIVAQAPARPPTSAPKEQQDQYAKDVAALRAKTLATAKSVETRVYFADYRDIGNGLKFPFRLRKAVAGETIEEINFDAFKTNARIDPRKFQPVL